MNKAVIGAIGGLVVGVASSQLLTSLNKEEPASRSLSDAVVSNQQTPRFGMTRTSESATETGNAKAKSKAEFANIIKERNVTKKVSQLIDYYSNLSPTELEQEIKNLSSLSWEDNMIARNLLFSKWAETSPKQALDYANRLGNRGFMERNSILQTWSSLNPEAAASYYSENRNMVDGRTAGVIAGEWARMNPQSALAWANTLPERDKRNAVRSVYSSMAETDPAAAASQAASMTSEQLRETNVLDVIATQWARQDWNATETWLSSLPTEQQESARRRAVESLATVDPTLAAEQLSGMAPGDDKNQAVATVARALAVEEPALAADLILKNASEEGNNRTGIENVVSSWVYSDAPAAKSWINALSNGEMKNQAITSYMRANPNQSYEENIAMASGITNNDRMKEFAVGSTVREWMQNDPAAAQTWLNNSNLSDRTKQFITEGPAAFRGNNAGNRRGLQAPGGRGNNRGPGRR